MNLKIRKWQKKTIMMEKSIQFVTTAYFLKDIFVLIVGQDITHTTKLKLKKAIILFGIEDIKIVVIDYNSKLTNVRRMLFSASCKQLIKNKNYENIYINTINMHFNSRSSFLCLRSFIYITIKL